jgi:hypothetical protein
MPKVTLALGIFLFFLLGSSLCHATLILTACSPTRIIIAADGLSLKPGAIPPSVPGCKIMQGADSCFFSIAGIQDIKSINCDLVPLAKRACRGNGSIIERANIFEQSALPEVQRAWQHIRAHEPEAYALMKRSGQAHVDVVFASGRSPLTVAIVQYVENASGNMVIDKRTNDISSFVRPPAYKEVGASENADIYHRQHPEIGQLDDIDFLRSMLVGAIGLETLPKRIGPPIAILQIDINGAKWIEQGACAKIKHYAQNSPSHTTETP